MDPNLLLDDNQQLINVIDQSVKCLMFKDTKREAKEKKKRRGLRQINNRNDSETSS